MVDAKYSWLKKHARKTDDEERTTCAAHISDLLAKRYKTWRIKSRSKKRYNVIKWRRRSLIMSWRGINHVRRGAECRPKIKVFKLRMESRSNIIIQLKRNKHETSF